jgi:molybdate transport system substrate-binding protein
MTWGKLAAGLAAAFLATACGSSGGAPTETLTVFAAASLTDSFTRMGQDVEEGRPGVRVALSFGPSEGLAAQIREGAPADVFASASPRWMDEVEANGPGLSRRSIFARNSLVIIVPVRNPAGVSSIGDLARPGVRLVLAAPGVPAGDYAREALEAAGVSGPAEANVVSNEEDVKAVVQKVLLGEADAGIVYRTDVTGIVEPGVEIVEVPDAINILASFPIAVILGSEHERLAAEFVDHVRGPGQAVLRSFGFLPANAAR